MSDVNPENLAWGMDLNRLDDHRAKFSHPTHGTEVSFTRENWVKMGRPTTVWIKPYSLESND